MTWEIWVERRDVKVAEGGRDRGWERVVAGIPTEQMAEKLAVKHWQNRIYKIIDTSPPAPEPVVPVEPVKENPV